jgi:hypothetical protein
MTDIRNVHGISYTVRECPICGKNDKLVMPDYECFEELYNKHGRATMHMGCDRCNLQMYEHSYNGPDFDKKMGRLVTQWNTRSGENG